MQAQEAEDRAKCALEESKRLQSMLKTTMEAALKANEEVESLRSPVRGFYQPLDCLESVPGGLPHPQNGRGNCGPRNVHPSRMLERSLPYLSYPFHVQEQAPMEPLSPSSQDVRQLEAEVTSLRGSLAREREVAMARQEELLVRA